MAEQKMLKPAVTVTAGDKVIGMAVKMEAKPGTKTPNAGGWNPTIMLCGDAPNDTLTLDLTLQATALAVQAGWVLGTYLGRENMAGRPGLTCTYYHVWMAVISL
jgi:hypothetical protein